MNDFALGPTRYATLTTRNLDSHVHAWTHWLEQEMVFEGLVTPGQAELWDQPNTEGLKVCWLANNLGEPWLQIVEDPEAAYIDPFKYAGWLSLEINVQNVDALAEQLRESPFKIIGEPANLDVSKDIRAMQVVGPAGELLYLTEIKREIPGFDIPLARCRIDRLFIPVMLARNYQDSAATFLEQGAISEVQFETRITVVNQALGLPNETRHPISTIQLHGKNIIEIDAIPNIPVWEEDQERCGIKEIAFAIQQGIESITLDSGPFMNYTAKQITGGNREKIILLKDPV